MSEPFFKLFNGGTGSGRYPKGSAGNATVARAETGLADSHEKLKKLSENNFTKIFGRPVGFTVGDNERLSAIQKVGDTTQDLKETLRKVAQQNNGFLPTSKRPTLKEIGLAQKLLPKADPKQFKHGDTKEVVIPKGISKGKKVKFKFNRQWDFKGDKNGHITGAWIPPVHVEHPNFKV